MLRITAIPDAGSVTLRLEGKLLEAWCGELHLACQSASAESGKGAEGGRIQLDLSDVSFIDRSGVRVVRALLEKGITISRCSNFVAELLHEPEQI